MVFIVYILSISYAIFICWCIAGWMRLPEEKDKPPTGDEPYVSVIIPARNEEENIYGCLDDFLHQDYPKERFEIIVVNDHSTDSTAELVKKFIAANPGLKGKIIKPDSNQENNLYKKQAITGGINSAAGTLIITTDADCRRGSKWLSTIARFYHQHHSNLISAPVFIESGKTWIEKIQSLEFLGLIAIGAASIGNKMPLMCNGANLAFPKFLFYEVDGYNSKKNIATGDDTQLLMKIINRGKNEIHFLKSLSATVTTQAKKSLNELLQQRQRWASKIPLHMNAFTIFIAGIAFFLHFGLLVQAAMIFITGNAWNFIIPLLIKMIPEFILLTMICRFARKSHLLNLFLPAQIIYPIYISFVGLTSLFGRHEWKGRTQ